MLKNGELKTKVTKGALWLESTICCLIKWSQLMKSSSSIYWRHCDCSCATVEAPVNHPDVYWRSSMVSCRQSRRFLKCIEDIFLSKVLDSINKGTILDLLLSNANDLTGDMRIGGCLDSSDQAMVWFTL